MTKRRTKLLLIASTISFALIVIAVFVFIFSFSADTIVRYEDGSVSRKWTVEGDSATMILDNTTLAGADKIQLGFQTTGTTETREGWDINLPAEVKRDNIFLTANNSPSISNIAVDPSSGDIYLAAGTYQNSTSGGGGKKFMIYHLDKNGALVNRIGSDIFADLNDLSIHHYPVTLAVGSSGNLYVVDALNTGSNWYSTFWLYIFTPQGNSLQKFNLSQLAQSLGYHPYQGIKDVAIDPSDGTYYITFSKTDNMDRVTTDQIVQLDTNFKKIRSIDVGGSYIYGYGSFYSNAQKLAVSKNYLVSFGAGSLVVYNKTTLNKIVEKKILDLDGYYGSMGDPAISVDESKVFFYRYVNYPEDKKIRVFNLGDLSLIKEIPANLTWYGQYTGSNIALDSANNSYMVDNSWQVIQSGGYTYFHKIVVKSFGGGAPTNPSHFPSGNLALSKVDSGQDDTNWENLSWTGSAPDKTSISGCIVAGNDTENLPAISDANCLTASGNFPTPPRGRYANIVMALKTSDGMVTPTVFDLTAFYRPPSEAKITSVSPNSNSYYGLTIIKGSGFGNEEGQLKFQGVDVPTSYIISWKDGEIAARVPYGTIDGKWEIRPKNKDIVIDSPADYHILNPVVSSFSAVRQNGKIILTVQGSKFMGDYAESTGYKGGIFIGANLIPQQNISEWKDTEVKIEVPATDQFALGKVQVMTPPQYPYMPIYSWNNGITGISAEQYDQAKVQ